MSSNPDEDWEIISARQDVRDALKVLEEKPTPFNALDLQYKQQQLKKLCQLRVVKP